MFCLDGGIAVQQQICFLSAADAVQNRFALSRQQTRFALWSVFLGFVKIVRWPCKPNPAAFSTPSQPLIVATVNKAAQKTTDF